MGKARRRKKEQIANQKQNPKAKGVAEGEGAEIKETSTMSPLPGKNEAIRPKRIRKEFRKVREEKSYQAWINSVDMIS